MDNSIDHNINNTNTNTNNVDNKDNIDNIDNIDNKDNKDNKDSKEDSEIITYDYKGKYKIQFEEVKNSSSIFDFSSIINKIMKRETLDEDELHKIFILLFVIIAHILFFYEIYNFLYLE